MLLYIHNHESTNDFLFLKQITKIKNLNKKTLQ